MIDMAQAAPSTAQTWIPAAATAVATLLVGYMVYRNARRANRSSESSSLSASQLAWTQQAMTEAKEAKAEVREATVAARAATKAAGDAERRLTEVNDMAGRLIDWIGRVVRKAHEVNVIDSTPDDVRELVRIINGGPPEISTSKLTVGG